jgi:PPOX class probable F420-dependent enzyme
MTSDEINALLAKPLEAVLAVSRPSGGPQLTVMWFYWDGEAFYFSTTRDRSKYPNIKRNPAVSLLVNDETAHHYVVAYGRAELIEDDYDLIARLTDPIIAKYAPDAPPRTPEGERADHRLIIVLRPDTLVSR